MRADHRPGWWRAIKGLFSRTFLEAVGVLTLILLVFGFIIWLFERNMNHDQFDKKAHKGIGAGFWWSAVTMTTVGYGDKAPVTIGGRIIALICMFSGMIIVSTLTATIASTLTVASLDTGISGPGDLPNTISGEIRNTTSEIYMTDRGMNPVLFDNAQNALKALEMKEIEALVYDAPILEYIVNQEYPGRLMVLPHLFDRQQYGIALPFNSPMRQDINRIMLSIIESGMFENIKQRYLGK